MRYPARHLALFALVAATGIGALPLPAQAVGATVSMTTCGPNFCFQPTTINVPTGGSVSWSNSSAPQHTATSDSPGGWDTGIVNANNSAAVSFPTAGIFNYHCSIHSYMNGTVLVGVTAQIAFPSVVNTAYGGYTTATYIENIGGPPASVHIRYFDQSGAPIGAGDDVANLPTHATWTVRQDNGNSLSPGTAGSAIVYSDQAIAGFVNEFAPGNGDASSYSGILIGPDTGPALHAPTIANNAYGGYTTGLGIINVGDATTDIVIRYRDPKGVLVQTQTFSGVPPHAYRDAYSGGVGLPDGFAGTATITDGGPTSPSPPLAAIVNEVGPGGQFSSYDLPVGGTNILHAPIMLNNAYGGFYTGIGIRNTTSVSGTVTITYYDSSGAVAKAVTSPIDADGYLAVYQGDPVVGPPASGTGYSATLTTSVFIAAVVNEVAPAGASSARQSTSYNMSRGGNVVADAPLVENAGSDGWSTGVGIMNTGSSSVNATIKYFNLVTGSMITSKTVTVPGHAFKGVYTPDDLSPGTRATAQIIGSVSGPVAAIVNESNASTFMSYGR